MYSGVHNTFLCKDVARECGVQRSLQECKGVWWMPWLQEAMKDVIWLRKVSVRCQITYDPEVSEWGNPPTDGRKLCYAAAHPGK